MKPFVYLVIIGAVGILAMAGVRIYNNIIVNNFNKNQEKIYAETCLFSTKLMPEEEYKLAQQKKGEAVIQLADFSLLEDRGIVFVQNRLPAKQFHSFANGMRINVKEDEDELFFVLDKVYLQRFMIDKHCIIWKWEMADDEDY